MGLEVSLYETFVQYNEFAYTLFKYTNKPEASVDLFCGPRILRKNFPSNFPRNGMFFAFLRAPQRPSEGECNNCTKKMVRFLHTLRGMQALYHSFGTILAFPAASGPGPPKKSRFFVLTFAFQCCIIGMLGLIERTLEVLRGPLK